MRLIRISIEGFRSIGEKLDVVIDRRVTVLLGANDHGKTNFLDALAFLNMDTSFQADDLNWDRAEQGDALPALLYELELSSSERAELGCLNTAERWLAAASEIRSSADEDLDGVADVVLDADNQIQEHDAAKEGAAASVQEAKDASNAAPDDPDLKGAVSAAEKSLRQIERELAKTRQTKSDAEAQIQHFGLARALADGRTYEAHCLRDSGEIPEGYVEQLAQEAESLASSQAKALKRASAKANAARTKLDELPEGEEEARQAATQDLQAAEEEEAKLQGESKDGGRRAGQLRAAADALAGVAARDPKIVELDIDIASLSKQEAVPQAICVSRAGLKGKLEHKPCDGIEDAALRELLARRLPRVEVVEPTEKLPDDVSAAQLEQGSSPFMRGIFLYAGIEKSEWDWIFTQDARSQMRLEKASKQLNETLRASWSQGKQLTFRLAHDSKRSKITLGIEDPSVSSTFTKPSQRSSGFAHFFALKTVLHALQNEAPASSYIWLFDEPGIHLHPDGQRDLIQVMETLSETNQVLYTTHSIFLANQNYPARHRLLTRTGAGTKLDAKPFLSRWRTALEALGLSLAGTVLFAPHVLLVEGDSDAIYVTAMLRRLIAGDLLDLDLNRFAAIPTGDASNTGALIRILADGAPGSLRPQLGVLVDGDKGGKDRLKSVRKLLEKRKVPSKELTQKTTTEDHLPAARHLYLNAVCAYLKEVADLTKAQEDALAKSYESRFGDTDATVGLAEWTRTEAKEIAGLEEKPSSVGIARTYSSLLEDLPVNELSAKDLTRAKRLAEWVTTELKVPGQTLEQDRIFQSSEE